MLPSRTTVAILGLALSALALPAQAPKATDARICLNCHKPAAGMLRGNFDNFAPKNSSFQLRIDDGVEVLRFDPAALKVKSNEPGASLEDSLKAIKKGHEVRVEYVEKAGAKFAQVLSVKPPVSLDVKDTISLAEVERLVALGPAQGGYFLVDCRPAPRFQEGSIPTAVNLPFPAFDRNVDKLPADKAALIIFYCSGKTCNMSPGSLRKAQKLGYTNVKVFVDGMPGWYSRNYGVIAAKDFKEAFLDKDNPAIVLDLCGHAEQGAPKGAVAASPARIAGLLKEFPAAKLKPPVLVVDDLGGEQARKVAREIVKAGYSGVNVLAGGCRAWKDTGLPTAEGRLATAVAYTPKPRPGSIPAAEFARIAGLPPERRAGVVILDVRNPDETRNGVIKGALLIPEPQLQARLSELPRDKRICVHCSTGIRAELAYHQLKEKGYDAAFLNAELTVIDTGEFVID